MIPHETAVLLNMYLGEYVRAEVIHARLLGLGLEKPVSLRTVKDTLVKLAKANLVESIREPVGQGVGPRKLWRRANPPPRHTVTGHFKAGPAIAEKKEKKKYKPAQSHPWSYTQAAPAHLPRKKKK